ncbi:MAG TPA: DNA internalization-related competence protein ComEC/Rec2 [Kofleriaceae bacterium]|jgi:competence protein ComEC
MSGRAPSAPSALLGRPRLAPRIGGPLPLAVGLAVGIAFAAWFGMLMSPARWFMAIGLALVALRRPRWTWPIVATAFGLALGCVTREANLGADAASTLRREPDRIVGLVLGPVVPTNHGCGASIETDGGASIWAWSERVLLPGQRVDIRGRTTWRGDQLEIVSARVAIISDEPGVTAHVWRWAARVQQSWVKRIDDAGGPAAARAALEGIATGDRSAIPPELDDRFRATGIFHVLSVSGLHLAVVAGLVFMLLRRLVAASPWGGRIHSARWAAPPALLVAIAYTLITGAQIATLRSLVVVAIVFVGHAIDRPVRLVDALGAAALGLLILRPQDLLDPSFQLSFTAALALALQWRPTPVPTGQTGSWLRRKLRAGVEWIKRGVVTSAWVTLSTAPLTALHFQQIAPAGIVGNLILTPLLEAVALPLALAGILLGPFGGPFIRIATELTALVDQGAALGAHTAIVGSVAVASATAAALLVVLSLVLAAVGPIKRRWIGWLALCVVWAGARSPTTIGTLRVTFLDVGQGDAALIELPHGGAWLVDAGGVASSRNLAQASATGLVVQRALAASGHDRIDLAILSHPHPDHYLGFASLRAPIATLWTPMDNELDAEIASAPIRERGMPSWAAIAKTLEARGTRIEHPPLGSAFEQDGVELRVWAPRFRESDGGAEIEASDPVRTVNDNSLVIELRYRGRSILFAGDTEAEGEATMTAAGLPHVDIVKVGHHGSPTSSSAAFVTATHPVLAVISCGHGNSFGFPSRDVVARWRRAGAQVLRTDVNGAVSVSIDASGALQIEAVRSPDGAW